MGAVYSLISDKNIIYYIIIIYFVICFFTIDIPKKSKESVSKPRLQNKKRWLESEIQHLQEELNQVSHELDDPVIPDHVLAVIRSEIREQLRRNE
jgi:hypothetical protein